MLLDSVVPRDSCQLLCQLVDEATFPAHLAALQILHSRLDDDDVAVTSDGRLTTLVSCLLKVHATKGVARSKNVGWTCMASARSTSL